jgi:nicotinate-nucleotide adenylyltransferase
MKIGLYFGSFNPVHIGHIAIAGYLSEFTDLDQIWFVVSPHNPLKKKETLLDNYDRLKMVELALGNSYKLRPCDVEFSMPVPSYTIDTMMYLEEKNRSVIFCLIMGEDNLSTVHKWKNADLLFGKYPIYVYPRNRTVVGFSEQASEILSKADIKMVAAPIMDISGSFIRQGIKDSKDMSCFLPPAVWKYIEENRLYC